MIPESLRVVYISPITVSEPTSGRSYFVSPAFYTPDGDEKRGVSALSWATGLAEKHNAFVLEKVVPNEPLKTLILTGIEHRNEGGLAYKVVTPDGFYVDLRDEEFWHSFFAGNVDSKTGEIHGDFVWVMNVTQIRLTYIGSPVYNKAKDSMREKAERKTRRVLSTGDLEIGKFYIPDLDYPEVGFFYLGRVRHRGVKKFAWRSANFGDIYPNIVVTTSIRTLLAEGQAPRSPFGFRQGSFVDTYGQGYDFVDDNDASIVDWADEAPEHLVGRGLYVRQDGLNEQKQFLASLRDRSDITLEARNWLQTRSELLSRNSFVLLVRVARRYGCTLVVEALESRKEGV